MIDHEPPADLRSDDTRSKFKVRSRGHGPWMAQSPCTAAKSIVISRNQTKHIVIVDW